jgi:xylan 1,4-beta-xylosidase
VWKKMRSPPAPTAGQYAELEKASQLTAGPVEAVRTADGEMVTRVQLPRQAVVLLVLDLKQATIP